MSTAVANSPLVANYARFPVRFVRGAGCRLYDDAGRDYLDGFSGIAVNALGHGHPRLVQAIAQQTASLMHVSNLYHSDPPERLAALITGHCFADRIFFCNSGTEANEAAFKLARLWNHRTQGGKRTRIISTHGGFHGRTMGALAMTGTPAYHEGFGPHFPVDFIPYGDLPALEAALGDDVAAVWLEPIQGENGVFVPAAGYLAGARAACTRHGALLALDEVQTGIGRTGSLFAHQLAGITPDILILAKGLGGGLPIGAIAVGETLAALFTPGTHGTTFGGNLVACAAGTVVVEEVLAPGFLAAVTARGEQLRAGLARIFTPQARAIRGQGLICGVALDRAPRPLAETALAEGLVVGTAGDNTLRLLPPLIISAAEIDELLERLDRAWSRLRG